MRKVLLVLLISLSVLSTFGIAYLSYSQGCNHVPPLFGGREERYDVVKTQDWLGNCYVTYTIAKAIGEPLKPKGRVTTVTVKWVGDSWKRVKEEVRVE